jgi:DNA-binding response OmpR family regulator
MAIKTILIIEDDRFIGEMYARSLQKADYEVTWVVTGNDGINAARSQKFDLILLDIMLPEKRGTEVLATLRTDNPPSVTHVIVLTNFDQDEKSRAALQADADGYLIKADITPRRLIEIIKQLDPR